MLYLYIYKKIIIQAGMEVKPDIGQPIEMLGFSSSFVETSGKMGFQTIAEILAAGREDLLKREGFSYHWLGELVAFLSANKLIHLLQPMPGSNQD